MSMNLIIMFKYTLSYTFFIGLLLSFAGCKQTPEPTEPPVIINDAKYFNDIEQYRSKVNKYFLGESTPLGDSMLGNFKGVRYFPVDTNFRVIARFEAIEHGKVFKFLTTGTIADTYLTVGKLHFAIKGTACTLEVYANQDLMEEGTHIYFVPFWDYTNGETTYGGGRYLDMESFDAPAVIIDFNTAYQPYCFYNEVYSCPIPPAGNKLSIAITAGERI